MKFRPRDLLQVLATGALLALALHVAGVEPLLARMRDADPAWLTLAIALTVPMQALSARRWAVVSRLVGAPIDFRTALAEYYVALLVNSVAPGGVAGDALRVWRHGRGAPAADGGARFTRALHAVVIERAAGQLVLAGLVATGLLAWRGVAAPVVDGTGLPLAAFLGAGAVLAIAVLGVLGLGLARGSATGGLAALGRDLRRLAAAPAALVEVLALSAGAVASYVAIFLATARSLGQLPDAATGLALAVLGIPLVLCAMTLPVSVGGLGPREAAAVAVWPVLGLESVDGAAAALLYGAAILAGSLPGALVLRRRARGASAH